MPQIITKSQATRGSSAPASINEARRAEFKDFTMDFTNFYGFVKKMVQKNQYTYNVPPGSSANLYGEVRSAEFDGTG